jgi:hypothetical protein
MGRTVSGQVLVRMSTEEKERMLLELERERMNDILYALLFHMEPDGTCPVSFGNLEIDAWMTKDKVMDAIRHLEETGIITGTPGAGRRPGHYRITAVTDALLHGPKKQ